MAAVKREPTSARVNPKRLKLLNWGRALEVIGTPPTVMLLKDVCREPPATVPLLMYPLDTTPAVIVPLGSWAEANWP